MDKEAFLKAFMEDIWNNKKFDLIEKYVHPSYSIYLDFADPWEGKTLTHEDFINRLKYSFNSFPDMHFELTSTIAEENHVATTWILTGTHLGAIGPYPGTKKSIKTTGITIYHFKDNLINGHTQVFDRKTVIEQLGFNQ